MPLQDISGTGATAPTISSWAIFTTDPRGSRPAGVSPCAVPKPSRWPPPPCSGRRWPARQKTEPPRPGARWRESCRVCSEIPHRSIRLAGAHAGTARRVCTPTSLSAKAWALSKAFTSHPPAPSRRRRVPADRRLRRRHNRIPPLWPRCQRPGPGGAWRIAAAPADLLGGEIVGRARDICGSPLLRPARSARVDLCIACRNRLAGCARYRR